MRGAQLFKDSRSLSVSRSSSIQALAPTFPRAPEENLPDSPLFRFIFQFFNSAGQPSFRVYLSISLLNSTSHHSIPPREYLFRSLYCFRFLSSALTISRPTIGLRTLGGLDCTELNF
ncbi:hypothetical protein SDJN03_07257, partial [Cucurbita argyrosperma subsp. sororia]